MAIVLTDDKHYKDIADVIRTEAVAHGAKFKPESMAAEIKGACDYKYYEGHLAGDAEGFERGKQAEYDAFWDCLQYNGNRERYYGTFSGRGWNDDVFKPKYNIVPTDARMMFASDKEYYVGGVRDLYNCLKNAGVNLDFSKCTNFSMVWWYSAVTHIGVIDTRSASVIEQTFYNATNLHTIEKLILKDGGTQSFNYSPFSFCTSLANITIEGKIGATLSLNDCPLTKDSIISVVNALYDTASGKTLTLKTSAVTNAFGSTDSDEWKNLIATKSNWTITLA